MNKKIHVDEGKLPIDDEDDGWLEESIEEEYTPVSARNLPESAVNWGSSLVKSFIAEKKEAGSKLKISSAKVDDVNDVDDVEEDDDDFDMDRF
jgi:hypothetical protein